MRYFPSPPCSRTRRCITCRARPLQRCFGPLSCFVRLRRPGCRRRTHSFRSVYESPSHCCQDHITARVRCAGRQCTCALCQINRFTSFQTAQERTPNSSCRRCTVVVCFVVGRTSTPRSHKEPQLTTRSSDLPVARERSPSRRILRGGRGLGRRRCCGSPVPR